ncbi:MAG: Uma2 family endonuclease [Chitinophagales bacterium]|nr:Uma2 family endonuclease [Chitinophagales bacterium]
MITSLDQLDLNKKYTYADYLTWRLKERVELIKGKIFKMSPAPNVRHQKISKILERAIDQYLEGKKCEMYHAPFDVKLSIPSQGSNVVNTVVQPDIFVICDLFKLDEQAYNGAPEIIIEILSPGNSKKEMQDKFKLYEQAGVLEYWLVDPIREFVIVYHLNEDGVYSGSQLYLANQYIPSKVLEGFSLDASQILNEQPL